MELTQEILGRLDEKEQLKIALESGKPELIAVVGRRRVGKTFLIRKRSVFCMKILMFFFDLVDFIIGFIRSQFYPSYFTTDGFRQ